MTSSEIGTLGMIGFLTIWIVAGYVSLRMACRGVKQSPDWMDQWTQ